MDEYNMELERSTMDTLHYAMEIGKCENQDEYEKLVKEHQNLYRNWEEYIGPKIKEKRLKRTHIAKGCGVTWPTADSFLISIPTHRENVIMLAIMLGMDEAETNDLLVRHAKFQKLYSKHPEDAIWIYMIRHGGSKEPKKLFDKYYACYEAMLQEYLKTDHQNDNPLGTMMADFLIPEGEAQVMLHPEVEPEFREMIAKLLPSFRKGYARLMDYIRGKLFEYDPVEFTINKVKPAEAFRHSDSFLRKYYNVIAELEQRHELPHRMFLVALGIHLRLTTDAINEMLELAGMGPLCPKDRLEGSVAFYLEEVYCEHPSIFKPDDLTVLPSQDALILAESNDELFSAPEETLASYIKRRLEETNIFKIEKKTPAKGKNDKSPDDKYIQELLQML